ncbi:ASCH domain-containing protein [Algicola sagamiensis]|uniref:ASCH domain-containing protein n=1 Tax=Algicola sagamiensis TaxID=163869 RepID=UPI000377F100|nr:ASCH domain-containing protein [Algicola sagamiensis]
MNIIDFNARNFAKLKQGKTTTVRLGDVDVVEGAAELICEDETLIYQAVVSKVQQAFFGDLGQEDAQTDGFGSVEELREELQRCYLRPILNSEPVTVIHFHSVQEKSGA